MAKKYQLHGAFPSKAGDSAYQVAQKNGFEGTEQEWLNSLVGPQGPQGPAGKDGKDGAHVKCFYPSLYAAITDLNNITTENSQDSGPVQMSFDDTGRVTISLLESVSESNRLTVSKDATIRLNSNTIEFGDSGMFDVTDSVTRFVIDSGTVSKTVGNGCVLKTAASYTEVCDATIISSSSSTNVITSSVEAGETHFNNVSISTAQLGTTQYARVAQVKAGARLCVNDCDILSSGPTNYTFVVQGELRVADSVITGLSTATESPDTGSTVVTSYDGAAVTISGSSFALSGVDGSTSVISSYGSLRVDNSSLSASGTPVAYGIIQLGSNATITGSTINATSTTDYACALELNYMTFVNAVNSNFTAIANGSVGVAGIANQSGSLHARDCVCFADAPNEHTSGVVNYESCVCVLKNTDVTGIHSGILNNSGDLYIQGGIFTGWTHGGIYCAGNSTGEDVINLNYINDAVIRCGYSGQFANELRAAEYPFEGCMYLGSASHTRVFLDGVEIGGTVTNFDNDAYSNGATPYAIVFRSTGYGDEVYRYETDNIAYISNSKILPNTDLIRVDRAQNDADSGHRVYVGSGTNIDNTMFTHPELAVFCDGTFRRTEALFNTREIVPADVIERGTDSDYVLPVATSDTLGGVKPAAKTDDMTQSVGVDELGGLWTVPGGSSENGSSSGALETLIDFTSTETTNEIRIYLETEDMVQKLRNARELRITVRVPRDEADTETTTKGEVEIGVYVNHNASILRNIEIIPAPNTTYVKNGNVVAAIFRNPVILSTQYCPIVYASDAASGSVSTAKVTCSLCRVDIFENINKHYFYITGTQNMPAGTRFILGVRA